MMRYECDAFAETPSGFEARIKIGASSEFFRGHFEGAPVLPGVALLVIAKEVLSRRVAALPALAGLAALRFRKPILPGERVTLAYARKSSNELLLTAHVAETLVADGRLHFTVEVPRA